MPRLRALTGGDLIRIFARFGFQEVSQRGSHVKLRRVLNGVRQNLRAVRRVGAGGAV
ncbi:MAG: type II toxin-antitoxin system HicA family toxin [Bryobacteraceae bacterium]|jgi:predicted RNA binding protein YcfA (HicA-like mRNA interferase family)